jgi:hypothetical protein
MTYKGFAKGKIIELEQSLPYREGQAVTVSVEPVYEELPPGSPLAILKVLSRLPDLLTGEIDELERAIQQGRLPIRFEGQFDSNKSDNTR